MSRSLREEMCEKNNELIFKQLSPNPQVRRARCDGELPIIRHAGGELRESEFLTQSFAFFKNLARSNLVFRQTDGHQADDFQVW